jgi:hypothetical protein
MNNNALGNIITDSLKGDAFEVPIPVTALVAGSVAFLVVLLFLGKLL